MKKFSDRKHGTYATYQAERKAGRDPCESCLKANATYHRKHYRKNDYYRYRVLKDNAARGRALWALARLHPEEFHALFMLEVGK